MAIEQDQVNIAADNLAAKGKKVTIATVRDVLGGGSFSTLSPMVKTWKEHHVAEAAAAEELPEDAQRAGEAAARTIWAAARADAAQRIELIEANAEQRIEDAETSTGEALTEVQRLEREIEMRDGEIQTLQKTLTGARAAHEDSAATVRARDATIEGLREQLSDQRSRADATAEKLETVREQLASEQARAAAATQNLESERQAHGDTRMAVDTQRSRADRAEERHTSVQAALTAITGERDTLRDEMKETVRELEKARATAEARAEQIEQLRAQRNAEPKAKPKRNR